MPSKFGLILSSLVICIIFFVGCGSLTKDLLKDPGVTVKSLDILDLKPEELSLQLNLFIENPNPIPLAISELNYSLNFAGEKVTDGIFESGIDVPANGSNTVKVPLKFKFNSLNRLMDNILKKTVSKEYSIEGSAKMGIFSIPFNKKGIIELNNFK